VPLPEPLANIADRIVGFYDRGSTPPFLVYQYEPSDEYAVRRELLELKRWLNAKHHIGCQTISLAVVFWEALEEHGQLDMVIEAERAGAYEDAQLAVRQVLASPPTLADRIVQRVATRGDEREAIFLYRAGALYPAHRTSPLLDVLKDRVDRPVTMLYPGRVVGDYGLSFMGKTEPAYGYRALIVPRGGRH
jgi:hypothetical protein